MKEFQLNFVTNKMSMRWLKILNYLEQNQNCTTGELAKLTNNTTRTIVSDILAIKEYFGSTIEISSSKIGYVFEDREPQNFIAGKRNLIDNEPLFVMLESVFFGEHYSLVEWSERFHISESTLGRYLKGIVPVLKEYNLDINFTPVDLVGEEVDIRTFFHAFYYDSDVTPHTVLPSIAIQNITIDMFGNSDFIDKQFSFFNDFNYWLYITIERCNIGKNIPTLNEELLGLIYQDENFDLFKKINHFIKRHHDTELPEIEIAYIYLLMISRRDMSDIQSNRSFFEKYSNYPAINSLAEVYTEHFFDRSNDKQRDQILVASFLAAERIKYLITPVMNHNIGDVNTFVLEAYHVTYKQEIDFIKNNQLWKKIFPTKNRNDVCMNLILVSEAIKNIHWRSTKRIAFILEGNHYICQNIKSRFQRLLGPFYTIYFPDSNELSLAYIQEQQIDLVVTNYSEYITDFVVNVDYLLMKAIPDAVDVNRLLRKINPRNTDFFSIGQVIG